MPSRDRSSHGLGAGLRFSSGALSLALLMCSPARADDWFRILAGAGYASTVVVAPSSPDVIYFAATDSGDGTVTFHRSLDGGSTWASPTFPTIHQGARPIGLAVNPIDSAVVYAATAAGAFRTSDGGDHWTSINAGLGPSVAGIAVDRRATSTIYAATSQGVFESTDAGASWSNISVGLLDGTGFPAEMQSVAIDPSSSGVLYAVSQLSIFKTINAGATWSRVFTLISGTVNALAIDPMNPSTLYAGTGLCVFAHGCRDVGLFKSVNGGADWASTLPGLAAPVTALALDPRVPSRIWVACGGIASSTDGGATWKSSPGPLPSGGSAGIAIAPTSPTAVYVVAYGDLFLGGFDVNGNPTCPSDGEHFCAANRFRISVSWRSGGGSSEVGSALPVTQNTGAFWFFDPTNLELVVKVLDGRSINGRWWVFYGSLTNVEFTLSVTDTQTGATKIYTNSQGQLASVADTSAF